MGRRWDDSVKRFIGKEAKVEDQNGKIFVGVIEAMLYNYGKVVLLESDIATGNAEAIIVNNVANIGILKTDYVGEVEEDSKNEIAKERVKSLLKEEG
jgi:hypothetical protein